MAAAAGAASRLPSRSDTFLPRRLATERGLATRVSASNVAFTTLCGLRLPRLFPPTPPMPSGSNTAPPRARRLPSVHVPCCFPSEGQTALTGGIGQRLDAAVIHIRAAVEHDLGHAGGKCALGNQLAHRRGGGFIGAGLQLRLQAGVEAG